MARWRYVLIAGCAASVHAQVARWADGVDGNWSEPSNWDINQVPDGPGFSVFIDTSANPLPYAVTLDITTTLQSFEISGGDAELAGLGTNGLTIENDARFGDGIMRGLTRLNVGGDIIFAGGFCNDICDTPINHTGAAADWTSGNIRFDGTTVFTNTPTSAFNITGGSLLEGTGVFNNTGTIVRDAGAGTTFFDGVTLNNTGTLRVDSGEFRTNGVDVNGNGNTLDTGSWIVTSGSTLTFDGQQILTNATSVRLEGTGSTFNALTDLRTNQGDLEFDAGATFTTDADFGNTGRLVVGDSSEFTVRTGSTFDNLVGTTLQGGVYELGGDLRFDGADIRTIDADLTLLGAGSIVDEGDADALVALDTVDGRFALEAKSFSTTASLTVNGDVAIDPTSTLEAQGTLTNQVGTTLQGGAFGIAGTLRYDGASLRTIDTDLTLDGPAATIEDLAFADALVQLETIGLDGDLRFLNGRDFTTNGDLTVADDGTDSGALTVGTGTTVEITGALTNFNAGVFTGGTFLVEGTLRAPDLDIDTLRADVTLAGAGAGFVDQADAPALRNLALIDTDGVLTLRDGHDLALSDDLVVLGELNIEDGGSPGPARTRLAVDGDLRVSTGTATLRGGTIDPTGVALVEQGGTLRGFGAILADTIAEGVVSPGSGETDLRDAGSLLFDGNLEFAQGATLEIGLGNLGGLESDTIEVSGILLLESGATLSLGLLPGSIELELGDRFTIATAGDLEMAESFVLDTSGLPSDIEVEVLYTSTSIDVLVVPAPGAALALAFGARGRRRGA